MVIVIGGTGLVGSHLLLKLAENEVEIIATYQTESKISQVEKLFRYYAPEHFAELFKKISWRKVDILDVFGLEELIAENDEVFHCAALVSFHRRDFSRLMKVNREGTTNVVNVCVAKNIRKLCFVSSTSAVTGGLEHQVDERLRWKKAPQTSGYSMSKYGAEREVWRGIEEGLTAVIVNPCVILGAGNWSDSSLTILGTIKKGLTFYPPGANAIVDARDVASVMEKLMKSEIVSQRYLLIGENISFKELFTRIALEMKKSPPKRAVGKFGLSLARYVFGFLYLFSKKRSPISKDNVNSALSSTVYSNQKCVNELKYSFYNLDETIKNAVRGRIE